MSFVVILAVVLCGILVIGTAFTVFGNRILKQA